MEFFVPLRQCIMNLSKADMEDNAAMFDESVSSSLSKDAMAMRLSEIYMKNIDAFLPMLGLTAVAYLRLIFESGNNGQLAALDGSVDKTYAPFTRLHNELEYLGLIHYTCNKFYVADILRTVVSDINVEQLDEQLITWQSMEACALGIISAYGMLEEDMFCRIFSSCYPDMSCNETAAFLHRRLGIVTKCRFYCTMDETWRHSDLIDDPESWYNILKVREKIPYRPYTRDEYQQFSANGLFKQPKNLDKMIGILADTGMSVVDAQETLWYAAIDQCMQLNVHTRIPDYIMCLMQSCRRKAAHFIDLYIAFANDVPTWINKGHTIRQFNRLTSSLYGQHHLHGSTTADAKDRFTQNVNIIAFPSVATAHKEKNRKVP